jgi:hypothetical protein
VIASPKSAAEKLSDQQLIGKVFADVAAGNAVSPGYARIVQDAIVVKPAGTPFPKTDKGNVIRAAFIRQFSPDIEAFYKYAEESEAGSGKALSRDGIQKLVRKELARELHLIDEGVLHENTDFFSLGLDSLGAIYIRRTLAREVNTGGTVLGNNIVFEYPTVQALVDYIGALSSGDEVRKESPQELLHRLLERNSSFRTHTVDRELKRVTKQTIVSLDKTCRPLHVANSYA